MVKAYGRRGGAAHVDELETDDETINNSVTYPDGTTVTGSPGGGGSSRAWDYKSSQSIGTWYENTSGKEIGVIVQLWIDSSPGSEVRYVVDINSTKNSSGVVQWADKDPVEGTIENLYFVVPDTWYYQVREVSGGAFLNDIQILD